MLPVPNILGTAPFVPKVALNLTLPVLHSAITFSRASNAGYFDANGNYQTAGNNVPRVDYDPLTRAVRGLLIEEQRTNLSPRWMGATTDWTANFSTVTDTGQTIQGLPAYTFTTTATSGQFCFMAVGPAVLTASTRYCVGVRVRRGNHPRAQISTSNNHFLPTVADAYLNYNFDTDTVTVAGSSLPAPTGGRILLADGSVWLWMAFTSGTAPTSGASILVLCVDSDTATRLAGTGTNGATVHFLGVQLEAGAYPTSPIISTGTALTRASDQVSVLGASFSSWYNQAGGTVRIKGMFGFPDAVNFRRWWDISDGSTNNRMQGGREATATPRAVAPSSVAGVAEFSPATVTIAGGFTPVNMVIQYSSSGKRISMNGGAVASTATSPPISGMTQLILGAQPGFSAANLLNGWIQSFEYFDKRDFTDAELQVLSA